MGRTPRPVARASLSWRELAMVINQAFVSKRSRHLYPGRTGSDTHLSTDHRLDHACGLHDRANISPRDSNHVDCSWIEAGALMDRGISLLLRPRIARSAHSIGL